MKYGMLTAVVAAVALCFSCTGRSPAPTPTTNGGEKPKLKFEISSEKNEYKVGDKITVKMKLTNISEETLLVNSALRVDSERQHPNMREVVFTILNETRGRLEFRAIIKQMPSHNWFELLKPGDSVERQEELTEWYDFGKSGKYLVQAYYENVQDPEQNKWGKQAYKGKVFSNTIVIKVVD